MTTEALVGAGLVLFRMVADNPSTARAAWMSAHLINTFLLLAALTWMAFSAWHRDGVRFPRDRQSRWLLGGAATVVLFVGVSGAVAALGDTLFPASSLAEGLREDLSPTSHLFSAPSAVAPGDCGARVRLSDLARHRSSSTQAGPRVRKLAFTLGGLVLIQIAVGLLNVALLAPVWTQLVHLLIADATWITLVLLALSSPPPISDASLVP